MRTKVETTSGEEYRRTRVPKVWGPFIAFTQREITLVTDEPTPSPNVGVFMAYGKTRL